MSQLICDHSIMGLAVAQQFYSGARRSRASDSRVTRSPKDCRVVVRRIGAGKSRAPGSMQPAKQPRESLAILAAMRWASSQILPVLSSFPSLFRLQKWTELNHPSAGGRRGSGGLAMHGGDARSDRALGCVDCDARIARARYSYQSHTMRALRAVAYLTNALQVRTLVAGEQLGRRATTGTLHVGSWNRGDFQCLKCSARMFASATGAQRNARVMRKLN